MEERVAPRVQRKDAYKENGFVTLFLWFLVLFWLVTLSKDKTRISGLMTSDYGAQILSYDTSGLSSSVGIWLGRLSGTGTGHRTSGTGPA